MLIHEHMTAIFESLWKQAKSLAELDHETTKGTLNELFVTDFLARFLPDPIGAVNGIIVDSFGFQSTQTDIILFDRRIMPPLLVASSVALCPIEAVLGTVEVRTRLHDEDEISGYSETRSKISEHARVLLGLEGIAPTPLNYLFCLNTPKDRQFKFLRDEAKTKPWLEENAPSLAGVNVMGHFSWMVVQRKWAYKAGDSVSFEETKRFTAVMIDNLRTVATDRWRVFSSVHRDLVGGYIRTPPH